MTTEEVTLGMYQALRKNCFPRSLALSATASKQREPGLEERHNDRVKQQC